MSGHIWDFAAQRQLRDLWLWNKIGGYSTKLGGGVQHGAGAPETEPTALPTPHPLQSVPELEKRARMKPEGHGDISNLAILEALFAK